MSDKHDEVVFERWGNLTLLGRSDGGAELFRPGRGGKGGRAPGGDGEDGSGPASIDVPASYVADVGRALLRMAWQAASDDERAVMKRDAEMDAVWAGRPNHAEEAALTRDPSPRNLFAESDFYREVRDLLNGQGRENVTDTPDHVLARFLERCLAAYEGAVLERPGHEGEGRR